MRTRTNHTASIDALLSAQEEVSKLKSELLQNGVTDDQINDRYLDLMEAENELRLGAPPQWINKA